MGRFGTGAFGKDSFGGGAFGKGSFGVSSSGAASNGIDSFTKLMLHMDGTDGSTTFTDSELTPKTVTANGDAQIDTAQSKFGGAAGLFDSTGDYLTANDHADWDFGSGDFTIDGWFKPAALGANQCIYNQSTGTGDDNNRIQLFLTSADKLRFLSQVGGVNQAFYATTSAAITDTEWHHYAFVRNGTNFYIFVDGTSAGLDTTTAISTNSMGDFTSTIKIGINFSTGDTPQFGWNGWVDEFRISKGIARWTANFTPPTAAYS